LPYALDRKYPNAGKSWVWQYVFPSGNRSVDPRSGQTRRHHLHEQTIQRAVKQAVRSADLTKPATPHTLRHYSEFRTMPTDGTGTHEGCDLLTFQKRVHAALSA